MVSDQLSGVSFVEQSINLRAFRELKVWEKAHHLARAVYKATMNFPASELYGLTSQIRRSGVSIAANIAEGCGRGSVTELARFMEIAMGSASELEYHLLLAHELELLDEQGYKLLENNVTEVKRMLSTFIRKLKADRQSLNADC